MGRKCSTDVDWLFVQYSATSNNENLSNIIFLPTQNQTFAKY